jgi:hypothetical protein
MKKLFNTTQPVKVGGKTFLFLPVVPSKKNQEATKSGQAKDLPTLLAPTLNSE